MIAFVDHFRLVARSVNDQPLRSLRLTRLKHPDNYRLSAFDVASDSDADTDDDEDFELFPEIESPRQPAPNPTIKIPSGIKTKKVVVKSQKKLDSRKPEPLEWKKTLKPAKKSNNDYDLSPNRFLRLSTATWEEQAYEYIRQKKLRESLASSQQVSTSPPNERQTNSFSQALAREGIVDVKDESKIGMLAELDLEKKCQPVVEYLISLGLDEERLQKIARRRKACFYVKINKVKERVQYLVSVGVKNEDICKIISRHPQVLEYTIERMMKPRINYLQSIGIPESRLGRVITVSPSLLECSLERSLKRRVRFLVEEVGVSEQDIWKVVLLSPQILTQSIEASLRPRVNFFIKKLGISHERVAKMITKHPQLLHYSIKNGVQPRIDFLRSIGMSDADIAKVLSRSSQILSLSVEKSLRPKCVYLTNDLKCELQAITRFPAYLSLSLEKRIQPRHMFLKSLNRLPEGPFPMHLLAITDHEFCERWAKSPLEDYLTFRESFLLSNFAKQFEKKHKLQYDA